MKKFLLNSALFVLILLFSSIVYMLVSSRIVEARDFKIYETDSNTLVMKKGVHYDLLFSGASHARNFSRHKNHIRLEGILNKTVFNIGQGAATCGVNEQFFYLKYFYSKGNTVDTIVYLLSPPLLYSPNLPIASNTFNLESFRFDFLFQYLFFDSENKSQRIFEYCRSKFFYSWISMKPKSLDSKVDSLIELDRNAVAEGIGMFYNPDNAIELFCKATTRIEEEIVFAKSKDTQLIFIIPPAVFGVWPEHERTLEFIQSMKLKYGIEYFDFSESIHDPSLYYDHHHLNTNGVTYFTEEYLKNIL